MDYDFGICGTYVSDIAISSRSCTERHGDFFESVVFHSSFEVSCFLLVVCLFFGWAVWFCSCFLFVLVAAFWLDGRHLRYRFTLFSCVGMDNLNQWIDDRQSFERARHPQKKKKGHGSTSPRCLVKPRGSTYARASVQVAGKWRINVSLQCWPLIEYFVRNTVG